HGPAEQSAFRPQEIHFGRTHDPDRGVRSTDSLRPQGDVYVREGRIQYRGVALDAPEPIPDPLVAPTVRGRIEVVTQARIVEPFQRALHGCAHAELAPARDGRIGVSR